MSGNNSRVKSNLESFNFKFIDLFSGVGGIRLPFDEIGGECVFSSEIE